MPFKTKAGTELPLIDLKGKPYLQVAHRVVWFREECPNWRITTEIIANTDTHCVVRASITDNSDGLGKTIATAHKREDAKHFADFMEKAETGAIGRALALCGYGTQFAPELDEEDRIVDSPVIPAKRLDPRQETVKACAARFGWAAHEVVSQLRSAFSVDKVADLDENQFSALIDMINANPKGAKK